MKTASVSTSATVYLVVALNEDLANELEGVTIREKDESQPKNHDIVPEFLTLKQGDIQLYDGGSKRWQPMVMPQILRASGLIPSSPSMVRTRNLKQVVGQERRKQSLPPAAKGEEKKQDSTIARTIEGSHTERTYLPKPGSEEKTVENWLNAIIASLRSLDQGSSSSSHSLLEGPLVRTWLQSTRAQCRWSAEFSMKPTSGTDLVLKPDQYSWQNVVSVLELTSENFSSRLCLQTTRKACGASAQLDRRFVIILTLANQPPRLHLFDRAGVAHPRRYNIHFHLNLPVRVLDTLTLGRLEHCFSPTISRMNTNCRRSRLTIQAAEKTNNTTPVLFNTEMIRGRATVCFLVDDTDRNVGKRYVVKDSWTYTGWATTEEEMLKRTKERKFNYEVTTLEAARTVRMGEEDDSTSLPRPSCLFSDDDPLPEIRVHRRLLLAPVGSPLAEFSCIQELVSVLIDIIEIHKILLDCGILHRDISINNILMSAGGPRPIREKDTEKLERLSERENIILERGFRRGLLINLDCARFIDGSSTGTSQGERTGLIPFMAIDTLCGYSKQEGATVHEPRHDLESIIYVLIWFCVLYRHPRDPERQPRSVESTCLHAWVLTGRKYYYKQDFQTLGCVKASETSTLTPMNQFTRYFEDLKKPVRLLYEAIGKSRMLDGPPLTHDSVRTILLDAFFDQQPDPQSDMKLWAELPTL
ncbi:hypothetical protein J3R82DRAFT_6090 [Butyriboletus roseoflavus]|nr:hypothetical protein J3R82DRAFT_6090 [Butyriboletus roseoflavus]